MKMKYYDQAVKCFTITGDVHMVDRCMAFSTAEKAGELMSGADTKVWRLTNDKSLVNKKFKTNLKKQIDQDHRDAYIQFAQAGKLFEAANQPRFAGSCYFSARNYTKAAVIFKQAEAFAQAAECLVLIASASPIGSSRRGERLIEAAKLFE
jgi:hypothetical protein